MKILIKLIVVVVLIIVIVGVVAVLAIDRIAKTGIEKGATYALGVPTTLDRADVGILAGTFEMAELHVANPPGFDEEFLGLGEGSVAVSLGTLREETVRLPHLRFADLSMTLQKKQGKTNYGVILDNIKRLESGEKPAEPAPEPEEGGKRFIIDEVTIRNVSVSVDLLPVGGALTKTTVTVPEIKLEGVGSGANKGVLLRELAPIIVKALMAAIVEAGGDNIPLEMLNDLKGQLANLQSLGDLGIDVLAGSAGKLEEITGGLGEALGDVTKDLGNLGEDTGEKVKGLGDEVKKGLGGLLGGGKDEEGDGGGD